MSVTAGAAGGKERAGANTLLVVLLILSIVVAVFDFGLLTINAGQDAKASALVTKIEVSSQQLSKVASEAAGGNLDAFSTLEATRNSLDSLLNKLKNGDTDKGMRGYANESGVAKEIADLDKAWAPLNTNATKILGYKEQVVSTKGVADDFNNKMPLLNSRMDEVVKILTEKNGSPSQVMISSRQMLLADRMQRRVQSILQGGEEAQSAADGLQRDAQFYGAVLAGLISGNPDLNIRAMDNPNAKEILAAINTEWTARFGNCAAGRQASRRPGLDRQSDHAAQG
jgi:twitching motility protein PilJ